MISEHLRLKHKLKEDLRTFADMMHSDLLSDDEKKILHYIYISRDNYQFIGDKMGISESTVKKRHNEILKKISKILQEGL